MTDLTAITRDLGKAYKKWKAGEKEKERYRKKFFDAVTSVSADDLDEKLITVVLKEGDTIEAYVERQHPGWTLDDVREYDDGRIEAILIADPAFVPFTFVNPDDGMVYKRQISSGGQVLDDERLRAENPELWLAITEVPNFDAVVQLVRPMLGTYFSDEQADTWVNERWSGPRDLKNLDELDAETQSALAEYIHPGKPKVSLPAPSKATEEQLEAVVDGPE